jgi:hypothetical protein
MLGTAALMALEPPMLRSQTASDENAGASSADYGAPGYAQPEARAA